MFQINKEFVNHDNSVYWFKKRQVEMLPVFIDAFFSIINKIKPGNSYTIEDTPIEHFDNIYAINNFKVMAKGKKYSETVFLEIDKPNIVFDNYFCLKNVFYSPILYIVDKPIIFKKKSVKLSSLFFPITINFESFYVSFMRMRYPLNRFLTLIFGKSDADKICNAFNIENNCSYKDAHYSILHPLFQYEYCESINPLEFFDNLFFDNYTKKLFESFYPAFESVSIIKLIVHCLKKFKQRPEFNDLAHKRLAFAEMLFAPFIWHGAGFVSSYLKNEVKRVEIKAKQTCIIDHFYNSTKGGLSGNFVYNNINGLSGVIAAKATFKNPKIKSQIPLSVNDIHPSHYKKICTLSIGNKNPGVNISFTSDTLIDHFTGEFL